MNAAATTGNPSPARTWNGSCPGTPAPETSAPGHSRPRPDNRTGTAAITASPRTRSRRPLAYPITGLPNTYDGTGGLRPAKRSLMVGVIKGCEVESGLGEEAVDEADKHRLQLAQLGRGELAAG